MILKVAGLVFPQNRKLQLQFWMAYYHKVTQIEDGVFFDVLFRGWFAGFNFIVEMWKICYLDVPGS